MPARPNAEQPMPVRSIRMPDDEWAAICEAATLLEVKPAELVRIGARRAVTAARRAAAAGKP